MHYTGNCESCGMEHGLASGERAQSEARRLMRRLAEHGRIDWQAADADPRLRTDVLYGPAGGQMFGVMVCRDAADAVIVLRAFSGHFNGVPEVAGWVANVVPVHTPGQRAVEVAVAQHTRELSELGRNRVEDDTEAALLRRQRRLLSRQLMQRIFDRTYLKNFRGERRRLRQVFAGPAGIPSGTGDCCAPKLLNAASCDNLRPIEMAEFWWGAQRHEPRTEGRFYPACADKCEPILGFMLCGA